METIIIAAFSALDHIIKLINSLRSTAQQTGEWTPEMEAQFKTRRDQITAQGHWKIEP